MARNASHKTVKVTDTHENHGFQWRRNLFTDHAQFNEKCHGHKIVTKLAHTYDGNNNHHKYRTSCAYSYSKCKYSKLYQTD